jgi:hypothetical protein
MAFPSITQERELKASKFLKLHFILTEERLAEFFNSIPSLRYIPVGKVFDLEEPLPAIDSFLSHYREYLAQTIRGKLVSAHPFRLPLSGAFSLTDQAFGIQTVGQHQQLFKPRMPVLQFQLMSFIVGIDDEIHFTFGKDAITIGLQASYPQLFIDENHQIKNGLLVNDSPNAALYKNFSAFLREHTTLMKFQIKGKTRISTIRLSPELLPMIQQHPSLAPYMVS